MLARWTVRGTGFGRVWYRSLSVPRVGLWSGWPKGRRVGRILGLPVRLGVEVAT